MAYDDDETLGTDGSGENSDTDDDDSGSNDNTVFELIGEVEEPTPLPEIGEAGCFSDIITKLGDSKNSQTLNYEINKQEEAAKTTKNYAFGRF